LVVLLRVEFLPYTGRENMLVALVPSTINNFCEGGIIFGAFKVCLLFWLLARFGVRGKGKRVVIIQIWRIGGVGSAGDWRLGAVIE